MQSIAAEAPDGVTRRPQPPGGAIATDGAVLPPAPPSTLSQPSTEQSPSSRSSHPADRTFRRFGKGSSQPLAIVIGRGYTALGALRCLADAGIPTYSACPQGEVATRSRWYRPLPGPSPWDGAVGPGTRELLAALPMDTAVLIPGADDAALWLSDIPGSPLSERFKVSSSSRATLQILQDKSRFGDYLAANGIPHPRTFTIGSTADIEAIPFDELDRVFIKPADSQSFSKATGAKGVWAKDRAEFMAAWTQLNERGFTLIAQEYVPGESSDHYFIDGFRDREGRLPGLFARRRERIFPPDFGNSSYCRSIPLSDVAGARESLEVLLAGLEYRGIFSAEFKRDKRNGEFRILEVNTRAWWYVEFAARCGVNVCQMAYEDALGHTVKPAPRDYRVGAGCVNLVEDVRSVLAQDPATRQPLTTTLNQWLRAHYHVFRLDDPGPGLLATWRLLRQVVA